MSVNKDRPHFMVLPEDDANRQLANGFHLEVGAPRQMQVLEVAGGWNNVLSLFNSDHIIKMDSNELRYMVLLIDLDDRIDRLDVAREAIPDRLTDRVFILSTLTEPEDLKRAGLGSYETIGSELAKDCRDERDDIWRHHLFQHNASELGRLSRHLRPILFS